MADYRELGIRSYVSEPQRGQRDWQDRASERDIAYRVGIIGSFMDW